MVRIVALEEVSPAGIEALRAVPDFEVQELYRDDPEAVQMALQNAEALIVRSKTKVTAEFLRKASSLRVIGRPGTGVDNIDVKAATSRGIIVMNTPAGNSVSAAEHTVALILSALRKVPAADASMKQGKWEKSRFMGSELHDKTLGIIGLGKIGVEVARRALGFNLRLLAFDPYVSEQVALDLNVKLVSLEDLLAQSDVITLHTPLTPATRHIINAGALSSMKNGAFLINAARGELVDEEALISALKSDKLAGAALDVFTGEPKPNPELISLPNVVTTPHIAASTTEAQEKVGYDLAIQIRDFFQNGVVRNAVNFPSLSLAEYRIMAPYLELAKRLGSFVSQLSRGRMRGLRIGYFGELTDMNRHLLCSYVVTGALQSIMADAITTVNAIQVLKERGIHLIESSRTNERTYSNLLFVKLITDQIEVWAEATVLHKNLFRLASVFGIEIEAPLTGDMLIIRNWDTPGVIGGVGTILGENKVNIACFALGRNQEKHQAVGVVNVDSSIAEPVLQQIRDLPQILTASVVKI